MRHLYISLSLILSLATLLTALPFSLDPNNSSAISVELFESLEELARIVDISYCVGSTGIHKPFKCASRCHEFEGFELIEQWNTGMLMSDSCGYIALSHPPFDKRIIVAFRGTYSIANTVVDLSTTPAEYLPYPSDDDDDACITTGSMGNTQRLFANPANPSSSSASSSPAPQPDEPCKNCTVHAGFLTSWKNTRCTLIPLIEAAIAEHPDYQLTLVGHSLGGAVAALASLEFLGRGWDPQVTTFGEPRIGNRALVEYIDRRFKMDDQEARARTYRRVTHVNDPVPLLPLEEWGYDMHAGEIFISKPDLSPTRFDMRHCLGDSDPNCIESTPTTVSSSEGGPRDVRLNLPIVMRSFTSIPSVMQNLDLNLDSMDWSIPNRYRLWELFFAHRDYFWRLGLCVPKGDPKDWWREPYHRGDDTPIDDGNNQNGVDPVNDDL